ncbi:hypothetical protein KEM55_006350, partial [Ascosphaera atra]
MSSLLGANYESSSDDEASKQTPAAAPAPPTSLNAAPDVSIEDSSRMSLMLANPQSNALTYNARYEDMSRPAMGPVNPFRPDAAGVTNNLKRKNVLTGHAQETKISDATFNTGHRTFQSLGYTNDPTVAGAYVGDVANAA